MNPNFESCLKPARQLISLALLEDVGASNITTGIDCTTAAMAAGWQPARAHLTCRDSGVICGLEVAKLIVTEFGSSIELEVQAVDGESVQAGQSVGVLKGNAGQILTLERTILNFMGRLSGVATLTQKYVEQVVGTNAQILDTRKTIPGWRQLEKYAVACGGGTNHRMGLFDAAMIKDNHLAFLHSSAESVNSKDHALATVPLAVIQVKKWITENADRLPNGLQTQIHLEADTIEQVHIGLETDANLILLDNMSLDQLQQSVELRDRLAPKILLEASGGVNLNTVRSIAETGVDRISVGAITHSALNFDIGLDWVKKD